MTRQYETYYQEFCNEVHGALASYLFWRTLQNRSAEEKGVLDALNRTPLSWIFIRHSLQVSLFMTLGRIFDTDGGAFSVDDLLKCCIDDTSIFRREELRKRKLSQQHSQVPNWLDDYVSNAHESTVKDFQKMRGEVAKFRRIFQRNYLPIRHKLFAHRAKEYLGRNDALWKETNIAEIESIIWFLNDLKEALYQSYENGRKLVIISGEPDIAFYETDFSELFDHIVQANHT